MRSLLKKWGFRAAAVTLGLLPLLLIEAGLRLATEPQPAPLPAILDLHLLRPLFVPTDDGQRMQIDSSRIGLFAPASFASVKPDNTYRIFLLGGSTVQGRPYGPPTSFGAWLQLSLEAADPERHWEVVNCGGASYASYRVRKIVEEVLAYEPDLLILYTGHNEFLEERKYADVRSVSSGTSHLVRVASDLRIVQVLQRAIHRPDNLPRNVMPDAVETRLDRPGGLDRFERDRTWRAGVERDYQRNLTEILALAKSNGVPLITCVPASNIRDTPPFKSSLSPELDREQRTAFVSLLQSAKKEGATEGQRRRFLEAALEIDPHHAEAAYRYGRRMLQSDPAVAAKWLQVAEDYDVCPLRMTSTMRAAARRIFERQQVPTIDVAKMLAAQSSNGLPGDNLFVDHVHPTIECHQQIGNALFEKMESLGIVRRSDDFDQRRVEKFTARFATLDEIYFQRGKQRLEALQRWAAGQGGAATRPAKGWTSPSINRPSGPTGPR